jgi:hypothetical protein
MDHRVSAHAAEFTLAAYTCQRCVAPLITSSKSSKFRYGPTPPQSKIRYEAKRWCPEKWKRFFVTVTF